MRTLTRIIAPLAFLPLLLLAAPSDSADAQCYERPYYGNWYRNYGYQQRCAPTYNPYSYNRPVYRGRYSRSAPRVYRAPRPRYSRGYAWGCDRRYRRW